MLNAIALVAAIGAGVPLPLMDLLFGAFVTTFVEFSQGTRSASNFMNEVERLT